MCKVIERRKFLTQLIGGVAAVAAVRTFPFRVYSFPSELKILNPEIAPTVMSNGPVGGVWASLTPEEILADINKSLADIWGKSADDYIIVDDMFPMKKIRSDLSCISRKVPIHSNPIDMALSLEGVE
jgi:hypothetical protein